LAHFAAATFLDVSSKSMELCERPDQAIKMALRALDEIHARRFRPPLPSLPSAEALSMSSLKMFGQQRPFSAEVSCYTQVPQLQRVEPWNPLVPFDASHLDLPALSTVAACLWSIPATSGSSERVFSLMGRIDSIAHSRLTEDKFEQHTFLKANCST